MTEKYETFPRELHIALDKTQPEWRRALAMHRLHLKDRNPAWYNFMRVVFLFTILDYIVYRCHLVNFEHDQVPNLVEEKRDRKIIAVELDNIYFYPNPRVLDKDEAYSDWYAEVVRIVFKRQENRTQDLAAELAQSEIARISEATKLISSTR